MIRKPCPSCPWRVDQGADVIPGFSLELAEGLRGTCSGEWGAPVMACHGSRPGEEFACAGWLVAHGRDSLVVRFMVIEGRLDVEALDAGPGWPVLHEDFDDLIDKLRETTP